MSHERFLQLSDEQFQTLHLACETFERALRRGEPISIESTLQSAAADIRIDLFRELFAIELEWRGNQGSAWDAANYLTRFPDHAETVQELLLDSVPSENSPTLHSAVVGPPATIGRFRVESLLGRGAFGIVYQARDDSLNRTVAIKVPHATLVARPEHAVAYLAEARTVAKLDHPNIVPVYDVGSCTQFPLFIVSKFVAGISLAEKLRTSQLGVQESADLVELLADALHYAHTQGVVHRDVKPGNILLDSAGKPHFVDFGLALSDDRTNGGPRYAGTAAYMSPEQARGEGHRVDGRSDIFSLGIVLFELLVGQRPFRGDSDAEVMHRIATFEPQLPRQTTEPIPIELERICLKAMAKRLQDRYSSAHDMAADLRHLRTIRTNPSQHRSTTGYGENNSQRLSERSQKCGPTSISDSDARPIQIVPKGLRSFDEHDAAFFLELLPGVRDRDGLPESIRFWKSHIEQTDSEKTFAVGLLYGPSGCGKSSLVKAGLLPRLRRNLVVINLDASADMTETDLLRKLRKQCTWVPHDLDLRQTIAALRHTPQPTLSPPNRMPWGLAGPVIEANGRDQLAPKVLIVIDQLEQWLHARSEQDKSELTHALRQCDGGRVQSILMVRDDFWMSVTRFMRNLEIRLVEGHNSYAVDLFPKRHALRVLRAIGQAYGTLPTDDQEITSDQKQFLERVVESLAERGRVAPVRLTLCAQLMRDEPWELSTLKRVGGATGVGVAFLNETFVAPNAPPANRYHRAATRGLLKELLPELGSDLKGHSRSSDVLRIAAGYATREPDFYDLIHLLDHDLHLITPSAPEEAEATSDVNASSQPSQKELHYQLAHDFMVPSIRDWLTQQQRESRRGRAEIRLTELSELWRSRPEKRFLPSLVAFLYLRSSTRKASWTESNRQLMAASAKYHGLHSGIALLVLLLMGFLAQSVLTHTSRTHNLKLAGISLDGLEHARGPFVRTAMDELDKLPSDIVQELLQRRYATTTDRDRKLALAYARARAGDVDVDFLVASVQHVAPTEVENLCSALGNAKEDSRSAIHRAFVASETAGQWRLAARLAILAMLLDDPALAVRLSRVSVEPTARAMFFDEFSSWHGDTTRFAKYVRKMDDSGWQSFLCLAIGGVSPDDAGSMARNVWEPIFANWYANALDSGTHAASLWALRQWRVPITAARTSVSTPGANWNTNSLGMTMIRVPAGEFVRQDNAYQSGLGEQRVVISHPFLLCDHEVSRKQFVEFLADPQGHEGERPHDWSTDADDHISPTLEHPMNSVSWYDAVVFCNWLSRREGLIPAYEKTGMEDPVERRGLEAWRWLPHANGYRLPTEAEWELACRAGTSSRYVCGNDIGLLAQYATFSSSAVSVQGQNRPNNWGFFDMAGNVTEWCYDWSGAYPNVDHVTDPTGVEQSLMRVMRGGAYFDPPSKCDSSSRNRSGPWGRGGINGFRVARSLVGRP